MKKTIFLLCALVGVAGCYTVRTPLPDAKEVTQTAQKTWQEKKTALRNKHTAPAFPESLGGILQSDQWTIYREQEQEEFTGHVSYDNGTYIFKANYALSDRKNRTVTARGNVYLKYRQIDGSAYQAYADRARYHYQSGKGQLKSATQNPVKLILTEPAQTVTALAQQVDFDTTAQVFILTGNVHVTRVTPDGTQNMQARKMTLKQNEDYVYLDGDAVLSDGLRTLQANSVLYNGAKNEARATGSRPLVTGSAEQGTFAVIADEVTSDAQGNVVQLNGRVQGWLVSPELNNHKANTQF